jgi:hypothetical protein
MSSYADRVSIEGPSLMLTAKAAQNFALALHELATNCKVRRAVQSVRTRPYQLVGRQAEWSSSIPVPLAKRGGPHLTPPTGKGFGSAVLEQVMAEYFENPPQIEFAADGVGSSQ